MKIIIITLLTVFLLAAVVVAGNGWMHNFDGDYKNCAGYAGKFNKTIKEGFNHGTCKECFNENCEEGCKKSWGIAKKSFFSKFKFFTGGFFTEGIKHRFKSFFIKDTTFNKENYIEKYDTDGDGVLSKEEIIKAKEDWKS